MGDPLHPEYSGWMDESASVEVGTGGATLLLASVLLVTLAALVIIFALSSSPSEKPSPSHTSCEASR